jgi:hypothetical protein
MTWKQVGWICLLCVYGSVSGAVIAAILFGLALWVFYLLGFIGEVEAIFKVKVAIIYFTILGFLLGLVYGVRMFR